MTVFRIFRSTGFALIDILQFRHIGQPIGIDAVGSVVVIFYAGDHRVGLYVFQVNHIQSKSSLALELYSVSAFPVLHEFQPISASIAPMFVSLVHQDVNLLPPPFPFKTDFLAENIQAFQESIGDPTAGSRGVVTGLQCRIHHVRVVLSWCG